MQEVGDIVAAACLAHDIGNPPFGHAGEDAVRRYFAKSPIEGLSDRQQADLLYYEGNAQGFRILSRLQFEEYGGMRLIAATLGAFLKYPRESGQDFDSKRTEAKKFGAFQSELTFLESLVKTLCLPSYFGTKGGRGWRRHPLAYLVEAADDICNAILDLEDACRLGWISHDVVDSELRRIATSSPTYSSNTFQLYRNPRDGTGYLRAISIGVLVEECAAQFKKDAPAILTGASIDPLVKLCSKREPLESLGQLARTTCYENPKVLEREAAGYAAITGLLECFIPAALKAKHLTGSLESRMLQLLKQRALVDNAEVTNRYDRVLRVLDYISGMTDSYAIEIFRRLAGVKT
jgi:dGTPase